MNLDNLAQAIVTNAYFHFKGKRSDEKDALFLNWIKEQLIKVRKSGNDKPRQNVLDSQEGKCGAESSIRYTPG
jgi:hypothetical protein